MNIKIELLKKYVSDIINSHLEDFEIDACEVCNTVAIQMLSEIQDIIRSETNSDFEVVEKIIGVFEAYHVDFGCRHDSCPIWACLILLNQL